MLLLSSDEFVALDAIWRGGGGERSAKNARKLIN
jgi:hypothetical protein